MRGGPYLARSSSTTPAVKEIFSFPARVRLRLWSRLLGFLTYAPKANITLVPVGDRGSSGCGGARRGWKLACCHARPLLRGPTLWDVRAGGCASGACCGSPSATTPRSPVGGRGTSDRVGRGCGGAAEALRFVFTLGREAEKVLPPLSASGMLSLVFKPAGQ